MSEIRMGMARRDQMTLIDRDGVPHSLCRTTQEFEEYLAKVDLWVRSAPIVDAVEVVRCKDCQYRFQNNGHERDGCPISDNNIWMDDNDFCSHGIRKD